VTERRRLIELALRGLEAERVRIEQEIRTLAQELRKDGTGGRGIRTSRTAPNKGRPMSSAQKRKIAATMKKRWAERRKTANVA